MSIFLNAKIQIFSPQFAYIADAEEILFGSI